MIDDSTEQEDFNEDPTLHIEPSFGNSQDSSVRNTGARFKQRVRNGQCSSPTSRRATKCVYHLSKQPRPTKARRAVSLIPILISKESNPFNQRRQTATAEGDMQLDRKNTTGTLNRHDSQS